MELISALSLNGVIGNENGLLWKIPEDLQFYKESTIGKVLIVGRTTYMSLPKVALKDRTFIVLSKDEEFNLLRQWNDRIVRSKEEALKLLKDYFPDEEVIVIGGEQIYNLFIDEVDNAYITWINKTLEDDTFYNWFPIDTLFSDFDLTGDSSWKESSNQDSPKFKFTIYERTK